MVDKREVIFVFILLSICHFHALYTYVYMYVCLANTSKKTNKHATKTVDASPAKKGQDPHKYKHTTSPQNKPS